MAAYKMSALTQPNQIFCNQFYLYWTRILHNIFTGRSGPRKMSDGQFGTHFFNRFSIDLLNNINVCKRSCYTIFASCFIQNIVFFLKYNKYRKNKYTF